MSDLHAETVPYVARTRFEPQPPPVASSGVLGWMTQNLFSSISNTIVTVLAIALILYMLPGMLEWAVFHSVWNASSIKECRDIITASFGEGATGACWAVIHERFGQFIYGYYPVSLRWRPDVAFLLLVVAMVPVLFRTMRPLAYAMGGLLAIKLLIALYDVMTGAKVEVLTGPTTVLAVIAGILALVVGGEKQRPYWIWFTLIYPVIAYFLLWGGLVLQPVDSSKFGGFLLTAVIGVTGIAGSLPLGILLALGRRSMLPIVRTVCVIFIEFIRGVPLITLLFVASTLLNYFLPPGTNFNIVLRVLIMVTLFASAYMAEVIRGGLAALPKGQYEAADALGLGYWQSMRLIILPQALKISIPGIVNTFIGLFKDTTLVSIIALQDPLGLMKPILANSTWNGIVWELYIFIAFMFFVCCFAMSRYSMFLEQRLRAADRR
ncbi:amino acid ABC transporter permease [Acuticoccus sediminis]|uniref:Amino acid ABC transporter permease n=1 Tax=Acuticoccus sediminis TaxID=2184697 RepID=A0A8B2NRJ3_9HYPH|nr:amino acid ABC transporter permease [Acuticoccus sediminis]RAH99731.1 amino acid ABC transporter permease [Acuticoccus sediminis]